MTAMTDDPDLWIPITIWNLEKNLFKIALEAGRTISSAIRGEASSGVLCWPPGPTMIDGYRCNPSHKKRRAAFCARPNAGPNGRSTESPGVRRMSKVMHQFRQPDNI
jgi:hypothetical protein